MTVELKEIIQRRTGTLPDVSTLRRLFGESWQPISPADTFNFAKRYCQLALQMPRELAKDVAEQGADALIKFIAEFPSVLEQEILSLAAFHGEIKSAWEEPHVSIFVALCNTVHDVWAHLVGPEAKDDGAIEMQLLSTHVSTALDYGAGAGHFSLVLAGHGVAVDVVEVDPVKVEFLRFRASMAKLDDKIRLGSHRTHYDMIVAINVLDHMEQPLSAIRFFANHLHAGGILYTLAAFPNDGWHQADPKAIESCAEVLWRHFALSAIPTVIPWFDGFIRRGELSDTTDFCARYPCLHPKAQFQPEAGTTDSLLISKSFYTKPCSLNNDCIELCREFDGTRTLGDLAAEMECNPEELISFCRFLEAQRQFCWLDRPVENMVGNEVKVSQTAMKEIS